MIDPENGNPIRCRPYPIRAVCHVARCGYNDDADGRRSTAGRRDLWRYLTEGAAPEPTPPGHCDCRRCRDRGREPMTPAEADVVLSHLPDRLAVLALLGYAVFLGCQPCPYCGGPAPVFTDRADTAGLIEGGGCPYHRHLAVPSPLDAL